MRVEKIELYNLSTNKGKESFQEKRQVNKGSAIFGEMLSTAIKEIKASGQKEYESKEETR